MRPPLAVRRQRSPLNQLYRRVVTRRRRRLTALQPGRAVVSFTFDDVPASAIRQGGAVLEGHGARGTFYASFGRVAEGLFGTADVAALVDRGHELGCHTWGHVDCATATLGDLVDDLERNEVAAAAAAPGVPLRSFAYPFGNVDTASKELVGSRFASSRGIWPGIHRGDVDLDLLHGNALYGDGAGERGVRLVEEVASTGGWLVLFTHEVEASPSPWGIEPGELDRVVAAAVARGCEVLPVGDVVASLPPPRQV